MQVSMGTTGEVFGSSLEFTTGVSVRKRAIAERSNDLTQRFSMIFASRFQITRSIDYEEDLDQDIKEIEELVATPV